VSVSIDDQTSSAGRRSRTMRKLQSVTSVKPETATTPYSEIQLGGNGILSRLFLRNELVGTLLTGGATNGRNARSPKDTRCREPRSSGGVLMERLAQCHCGSLRAITSGAPLLVNMCHCKACQRRTGALAASGAAFAKAQVRIEGHTKVFERDGQSGRMA